MNAQDPDKLLSKAGAAVQGEAVDAVASSESQRKYPDLVVLYICLKP